MPSLDVISFQTDQPRSDGLIITTDITTHLHQKANLITRNNPEGKE